MTPLVLHPTDTSQWYALILEAESQTKINLAEETESYLVFLLMRSSKNTLWLDSMIGMDYLKALQEKGHIQQQLLIEVGDKSLLLSGFFSEITRKQQLDPKYYADIGQLAYARLGAFPNHARQKLYHDLSKQFYNLQQVLQAAKCHIHPEQSSSLF